MNKHDVSLPEKRNIVRKKLLKIIPVLERALKIMNDISQEQLRSLAVMILRSRTLSAGKMVMPLIR